MLQPAIHYFLHFGAPLLIALAWFRRAWLKSYLVLLATMAVDLDHLLASPVFMPCRCSIGFHPLHSYPAIVCYALLLFVPRLRLAGIGLLLHMVTDGIDCLMSLHYCA